MQLNSVLFEGNLESAPYRGHNADDRSWCSFTISNDEGVYMSVFIERPARVVEEAMTLHKGDTVRLVGKLAGSDDEPPFLKAEHVERIGSRCPECGRQIGDRPFCICKEAEKV